MFGLLNFLYIHIYLYICGIVSKTANNLPVINKKKQKQKILKFSFSIKVLPSMIFENLNSLETLNIQNNKLNRLPQDIMEHIIDTLRIIDITGKSNNINI